MMIAYVLGTITIYIAFMSLLVYLVFRSGGLLEALLKMRDSKVNALEEAFEKERQRLSNLTSIVNDFAGELSSATASLGNRMTSLESRYGRTSKKEEQEFLRQQFYSAVNNTPQQSPIHAEE